MKKSLYFILLTLFMAQEPSESFAMERKRHRDEISGKSEALREELVREELERKKRAEESESGSPVEQSANQKKVLIKLKNDKIIYLDKVIANIAKYFNNTTQPNLLTKEELETGIQFKAFDDSIVELTIHMLSMLYSLDHYPRCFDTDRKKQILRDALNKSIIDLGDQFDIIQAWHFAFYLGIPKLEQLFMQILVENICTPEFLLTFQGNEFLADDKYCQPTFEPDGYLPKPEEISPDNSDNEHFRELLKHALVEYVDVYFPDILQYSLDQTPGAAEFDDKSTTQRVCVTPDGKILFESWLNTIKIWNLNPKTNIYTLSQTLNTNGLLRICITTDGKLVSGFSDGSIKIWNLNPETNKYVLIQTLGAADNGHTSPVQSLGITPDGKIASGSFDGDIKIWNITPETQFLPPEKHKYKLFQTIDATHDNGHTKWVNTICATQDGKIVSGSLDKTIKIWNLNFKINKYVLFQTLSAADNDHTHNVNEVCATPDDKIVSGSFDGSIKIWDINPETNKYKLSQTLFEASDPDRINDPNRIYKLYSVYNLCVTPNHKLVSASDDKKLKIWNLNPETHLYKLFQTISKTDNVNGICAMLNGKIVSVSRDRSVKIWTQPNLQIEEIITRLKQRLVPDSQQESNEAPQNN